MNMIKLYDEVSWERMNEDGIGIGVQEYLIMMQHYAAGIKEIMTKLEILDEEFQAKFQYNPIHHISSRIKKPKSIRKKMLEMGIPRDTEAIAGNILDIAGIRVVCNYIEDVERVAGFLLRQDDVKLIKRKDYINNPKESGYRSLHLVVGIPIFLAEETIVMPVEVQIRTIAMDFWASLEHQLKYKNQELVTDKLKTRLMDCAEGISNLDAEMQEIQKEIYGLDNRMDVSPV